MDTLIGRSSKLSQLWMKLDTIVGRATKLSQWWIKLDTIVGRVNKLSQYWIKQLAGIWPRFVLCLYPHPNIWQVMAGCKGGWMEVGLVWWCSVILRLDRGLIIWTRWKLKGCYKKHPAYGRHWISWLVQRVAPIPKRTETNRKGGKKKKN